MPPETGGTTLRWMPKVHPRTHIAGWESRTGERARGRVSPDRDERNYNNVFRDVIRVIPRNVLDLRSGVVVDYDVIDTRRYTSNT